MLNVLNKVEYEEFMQMYPHINFLHAWEELQRKQEQGLQVEIVGMKEQDNYIAVAPIVYYPYFRKWRYAYSPRGILTDFENKTVLQTFSDLLKKHLRDKKAVYLKIDPYVEYQERDCYGNIVENGFKRDDIMQNLFSCGYIHQGFSTGYSANAQVRFMHTLSLKEKTEDILLKEMTSTCRYSVLHSEYEGLTIQEVKRNELESLQELYEYMGDKNDFHVHDISYLQGLYDHYKDKVVSYIAVLDVDVYWDSLEKEQKALEAKLAQYPEELSEKRKRKKKEVEIVYNSVCTKLEELKKYRSKSKSMILSGGTFLLFGKEVIYLMGGSYRDLKYLNASFAIQWKMIRYALHHGYDKYNFYGINGVFDETCEDYGVLKFKQSFGGQAEELLGDFELPIHKNKYRITKFIRKIKK